MQVQSPIRLMRELFSNKSSVITKSPIKGALPEWDQLEKKKERGTFAARQDHMLHEFRAKNSLE